jgi:hypothetical protein
VTLRVSGGRGAVYSNILSRALNSLFSRRGILLFLSAAGMRSGECTLEGVMLTQILSKLSASAVSKDQTGVLRHPLDSPVFRR